MSLVGNSHPTAGPSRDVRQGETPVKVGENTTEHVRGNITSPAREEEDLFDIVDVDDEQIRIEEATIMDAREVKTKEITIDPPALPQRSSLRQSRLLDSLKLNSIESATQSLTTTHDVYLSSEEDASSSADDFSDYDCESISDGSEGSSVRRRSQEVTARAVSVIYIGKPSIIDVTEERKSISASPVRKRPQSMAVFGRTSLSSTDSSSPESRAGHPLRQSSMSSSISSASTTNLLRTATPSFLSQDPYASGRYKLDTTSHVRSASSSYPKLPKSPTVVLHKFQKSISLARKRSRPNLKAAAAEDSVPPRATAARSTANLPALDTTQAVREAAQRPEPVSAATVTPQSPVTYNEIIQSAKLRRKHMMATSPITEQPSPPLSQPKSPTSPTTTAKRSILNSFNMNRRRSVKRP